MQTFPTRLRNTFCNIKKKAQLDNIYIDDDILSNIATKIDSNIRELEGTLNRLIATSSLTQAPITMEMAERAINDVVTNKEKVLSYDLIQETVAKYFNITVNDLKGSRRSNDIALPRQIAMYLCRNIAQMSTNAIGSCFGKKRSFNSTTCINKIEKDMKQDNNLKMVVDSVKNLITSVIIISKYIF